MRHLPLLLSAALALVPSLRSHSAESIEFNRQIRPLLSDRCFHCHGPDAADRKAGLRLDVRADAMKPAKSGAIAILPGKPEQSELLKRISLPAEDDDTMPPVKSHKPSFSTAEQDLIRRWIAAGAAYEGHWAFTAPQRPQVPESRAKNPVDAFVQQKLSSRGWQQNPPSDPAKLIRRLSLDLTGLPPTAEEVATFVKDPSEAAYEQLVDRLLRSPHYGEHMASSWLDAARYADSHGFQTDSSRTMWPWRDWVIRSFNENLPFDQFTLQQLAGDLLPQPREDQLVATGFNRNHRINGEGGLIPEEWRIENIMDRVETTGTTWLALTFNCCRCHDHKYDPISQKEFYQMFAFFNSVDEVGTIQGTSNRSGGNPDPFISVMDDAAKPKAAELAAALQRAKQAESEAMMQLPARLTAWEKSALKELRSAMPSWALLASQSVKSELGDKGATLTKQADESWLASGPNPNNDVYLIEAEVPKEGITALLLECLPDASLPNKSLGRYRNGNFVLTAVRVSVTDAAGKTTPYTLTNAEADYSQKGYDISKLIQPTGFVGWAVDGTTKKDMRRAKFTLAKPIRYTPGTKLSLRMEHNGIGQHNVGRLRFSTTGQPAAQATLLADNTLSHVLAALQLPEAKRSEAQKQTLKDYFIQHVPGPLMDATAAVKKAQTALDTFQIALPKTMVMKELSTPRTTHMLKRGEYDKPGEAVTAGLPSALPAMPKGLPMNRLGLAKWIVQPTHPLTARVWVNRMWEHFFGTGIVKTTENFGMQAEFPTHPELLDWLATEFVRTGWDMKAMQRLIVLSQSYRQSSIARAELLAADPENRYLARSSRLRLKGETLRDQALSFSGLLVPSIGGPSVRPYMPEGVWDETSKYGDLRGYQHQTDAGLYRRTLYTIWKRTAGPPTMLLFDSPTREVCTVKRSRTNTPLQALALLNEVTFVEAARALGEQMLRQGGSTPASRIQWAAQRVLGRSASAAELSVLERGWQARHAEFASQPDAARALLAFGEKKAPADLPLQDLATAAMTANVLMNLDEVITRE